MNEYKHYFEVCVCAESLSHVQLFATPWTVAHQAPLSMEIFQARKLEWVSTSYSKGSSQPICRWIFYCWVTREAHYEACKTAKACCGAQALGTRASIGEEVGSEVVPRELQSVGSPSVVHELSWSKACGDLTDQGWNPCPLHWQADSHPPYHQGNP